MRRSLLPWAFLLLAAAPAAAAVLAEEAAPEGPEVLGDREFALSNYAAAEGHYREALLRRPDDLHAARRLALLLTWKGEYREAIELYRRAISMEPSDLETRRGLATAYTWSEQYDQAIALHRELLEERPEDEGLTFEMAQAQAWSGDNDAAEETLRGLVARNPRHLKARVLLGQVHVWSGEPAKAETIFRAALTEEPGNATALSGLGDALADQGKYPEALASYERALSADPKNRAALSGRARVLHEQGRTPEALDAVRRALELYPDARDARRLGHAIGGPLRPTLQLFATTTQDTDDNDLGTWGGSYTHYLGGKGYVGATFTHAQTEATLGPQTPVARYGTLRVTGGWHASRHLSLYGEVGGERTSFPVSETRSHGAGSVTLEVNGPGWLTLVASASEERLVGTTQAFMNDVGIRAGTLTGIFRPHRSVGVRVTGQKAVFTDDDDFDVSSTFQIVPDLDDNNTRDLATAVASWRLPLRRPRLSVHYNVRWMSYDLDVDQGYFDPDRFVSNTAGFDISDVIARAFYWGGGVDYGFQKIDRREEDDVFSYRLLAGLNVGDAASIEGYYSRSDLAVQSVAGFKSTEAGIRLVVRFGGSLGPASPDRGVPKEKSGTSD